MSSGPIQLPARISKYELLEFLGGGMSHVFRARDTVLGRTVAIKILTPAGVADADTKARFLQEARTASSISHENILAVYDFGEEAGKPYMVMEFLRGRTLRAAIHDGLLPDLPSKLRIALQVARALGYVHQNQVIHRDVKPENINVDDSGRAKLMDFGIAKAADLSLTQPGYVLGTPYYMAPEQIMGKAVTGSVDIYAFGIMLYEMLLGTRPYGGDSIETIFYKIMHEPLDLSPLAMAGVPPEVVAVVNRCTRKEAEARYPDFNATVADLENALGTQIGPKVTTTAAAVAPPQPKPSSRTPLFAGIGVAVVLLAAGGAWWATRGPAKDTTTHSEEKKPKQEPPPEPPAQITTSTGVMHLVPAGKFLFGEARKPEELAAFYIDETEVSNGSYAAFCAAKNYPRPPGFAVTPDGKAAKPDLPVVNVTIGDARAFAAWAGKRLPNAKEWEKAARGSEGRTYPWGEEKDASRANVAQAAQGKAPTLQPVNAFPESASPYHALNMVGNVWEFIDEPVPASPEAIKFYAGRGMSPPPTASEPWVSTRGGSYKMPLDPSMTWDFQPVPERWAADSIGFRCVKDAK